jgi:hypothetical protein
MFKVGDSVQLAPIFGHTLIYTRGPGIVVDKCGSNLLEVQWTQINARSFCVHSTWCILEHLELVTSCLSLGEMLKECLE